MNRKDIKKQVLLERRRRRVRKKVSGTAERPRLRVTRSLKHIYAQLIDDENGRTLSTSSSIALKLENGSNIAAAREVGKSIAEKARDKAIETVCFDRGGRLYHGRVKALADAAREAGLQF